MEERCAKDLERFLNDYDALAKWKNDLHVGSLPRVKYVVRTTQPFSIQNYIDELTASAWGEWEGSILFAHFSPFEYEMEALGLPAFTAKTFPRSKIHFTYDKGGKDVYRFELKNGVVFPRNELEKRYDLIVARSSVLKNMRQRNNDANTLKNSGFKINIKTMSLNSNYVLADYYFDEEEMCPPANPMYLKEVDKFLVENPKENLIVVSGSLWHVKNQLKMFEQLDPSIIKGYKVVVIGPWSDKEYVKKIIHVCDQKKIEYYLLGRVCKEFARDIKTLSEISLIPMDMRKSGQPKGYPRTLGESIGSKCITLCNSPITIPKFYKDSCIVYNETLAEDFNLKLAECIKIVSDKNFISKYNWGDITMEKVCSETIEKCFNKMEKGE